MGKQQVDAADGFTNKQPKHFLIRKAEFFSDEAILIFIGKAKSQTDIGVPVIPMQIMTFLCKIKSKSGVQ